MRKNVFIGLTALVLVLGSGGVVYAATSTNMNGASEKMLLMMKQMHSNTTEQHVLDMYNKCQTGSGMHMRQSTNHSEHHDG